MIIVKLHFCIQDYTEVNSQKKLVALCLNSYHIIQLARFPFPLEMSPIYDTSSYIAAMVGVGETIHAIRESHYTLLLKYQN
jgi:hypothetical protein